MASGCPASCTRMPCFRSCCAEKLTSKTPNRRIGAADFCGTSSPWTRLRYRARGCTPVTKQDNYIFIRNLAGHQRSMLRALPDSVPRFAENDLPAATSARVGPPGGRSFASGLLRLDLSRIANPRLDTQLHIDLPMLVLLLIGHVTGHSHLWQPGVAVHRCAPDAPILNKWSATRNLSSDHVANSW